MPEPILEIKGLEKSFGALKATNGVTLDLYPGEIHALIGPNGAGKSTLIKQIVGEIRPGRRHHPLRGPSIDQLDAADRARLGLARTFQVSLIAPEMSALKNVMLAVEAREGRVFRFFRPVGRDLGLSEAAMATSTTPGLGERAAIRAADLSHGERRQLEFAIALALKPKVFLLDEPMAGLAARSSADDAFLDKLRARGADPADRARHGGGVRACRPHLGPGLRPGHRHRHRRRDPRQPGGPHRLPRNEAA